MDRSQRREADRSEPAEDSFEGNDCGGSSGGKGGGYAPPPQETPESDEDSA